MTTPHLSTRCPECGDAVSMPPVSGAVQKTTRIIEGRSEAIATVLYHCTNGACAGATVAYYVQKGGVLILLDQRPRWVYHKVPEDVPERSRAILQDANDAKASPIASAGGAVRAVEAMMAEVGYKERKLGLRKRIDQAVEDHKLPAAIGDWAHHVREIGNDSHTDEEPAPLPTKEDAEQALSFANLLAEYLFVLPARIRRAREAPAPETPESEAPLPSGTGPRPAIPRAGRAPAIPRA